MITETITRSVENHNSSGMYREPLIGFSAADDPLYGEVKTVIGPWHKYPAEVLPEVKSIVSFFIPFSRAVVEANRAAWPEPAREWVTSYHDCNSLLDLISEDVLQAEAGFLVRVVSRLTEAELFPIRRDVPENLRRDLQTYFGKEVSRYPEFPPNPEFRQPAFRF